MKAINSIQELDEAIGLLETKKNAEAIILKEEFKRTYESLKPANLIYSTIKDLVNLPNLKGNLLDTSLSLAAGYFSKKVFTGNSVNPIKHILGSLLQLAVTKLLTNNADDIKEGASKLFASLHDKNEK